jgi:transposase-like protein
MTQRRTCTVEFKTQVVLDLVSGAHSTADLCRQYQLNPQVLARYELTTTQNVSNLMGSVQTFICV